MQFALHVPQTIWLNDDPSTPDGPRTQINFSMNGADTSRCVMDVITPDGGTHHLLFHRGGELLEQQFVPKDADTVDPDAPPVNPADFIVDGRDTRADNPYTHVAPADADTAYRDAHGRVGGVQPPVEGDDLPDREKVMADAADNARKVREERKAEAAKTPEQRKEDAAKRDEEIAARREKLLENTRFAGQRPYNPQMSPASSPLPGSPAPQPYDQPNHGVVNTSQGQSFNTENPTAPPSNPTYGNAMPGPAGR